MSVVKMHADEAETSVELVARLLAAQFPLWADSSISSVSSAGTDNALYRLGDDLVVRLPRIHSAVAQVVKEHQWLPRLAPHLPLAIPVPIAQGKPAEGYPWPWSVSRWLEGETAAPERISDLRLAAIDLARFVAALQRIDPLGGPPPGPGNSFRGVPLSQRDSETREAILALHDRLDTEAATRVWETALMAPEWDRAPVWLHGDLLPGNLLVAQGRLSAVIDFGCLGVGDPACDLIPAWSLFSGESRDSFRSILQVDEAMWVRGRGFALSQALIFIPYYWDTNPVGVRSALHMVDEILADHSAPG